MKARIKQPTPPALLPTAGSPFVVAPHTLQFRCETAVYRGDSGSSVCYVTCDEVGRFVAAALNHFADSGEMAKYLSENAELTHPESKP